MPCHGVSQAEFDVFDVELARLDLGKVQNVVDQRQKRLGRFLHDRQVIALFGAHWCVEQQLGHAQDGVHRRANFVADVGHERALGAVGLVGRFLGPLELRLGLLLRRDIEHKAQTAVAAPFENGQAVEHVHSRAVLADQLLFPGRRSARGDELLDPLPVEPGHIPGR